METGKFEPKKRAPDRKLFPKLTEKDEYIPNTHIGMYSIFRNPKNQKVYMSESSCQNLRIKTFNGLLELFKKYGSPDFADFFNYNIEVISQLGLNYFAFHPKIAPLANIIECFEKPIETAYNTEMHISFGISKQLLKQYFTSGYVPKNLYPLPVKRDFILFNADEVYCGRNETIRVNRNALYRQFKDWCDIQGIDFEDGVMMALETLLKDYPAEQLKDRAAYDYVTIFDKHLWARPKVEKGKVSETVTLPKTVVNIANTIIERYNRDVNNITKQIDFSKYVANALYLLNSNIDLKYRDPELYQEQQRIEATAKHNLKRGGKNAAKEKRNTRK